MPTPTRSIAEPPAPGSLPADESSDTNELLAQVSSEASAALTSAIERVNTLAHTGRIDRAGLRTLREELERARRVGMLGQQISRIASARVRVYEERVDLTALLRDMVTQRHREFETKRIPLNQNLLPVMVVSDVTLVFAMFGSLLDWCLDHARGPVDLGLQLEGDPPKAHLTCSFAPDADAGATGGRPLDGRTMSWRLVETCARKLGLAMDNQRQAGRQVVRLGFTKTVLGTDTPDRTPEPGHDDAPSTHNSRPLAGSHLLVICARRDLRVEVREAVQSMGLMLDFVTDVEEAREFCAGGLPHAIVFEASQGGASMQRLVGELRTDSPSVVFVEIAESGKPLQVNTLGSHELSCVARPALREALPTALTYELTRVG